MLKKYQKEFKKHWNYSLKLKEGGKAWEREMKECEKYKALCLKTYR